VNRNDGRRRRGKIARKENGRISRREILPFQLFQLFALFLQ